MINDPTQPNYTTTNKVSFVAYWRVHYYRFWPCVAAESKRFKTWKNNDDDGADDASQDDGEYVVVVILI